MCFIKRLNKKKFIDKLTKVFVSFEILNQLQK
jgi:hypothetical protein